MVSATAVSMGPPSWTRAQQEHAKGPWGRARMWQREADNSSLRRVVFVESLTSGDRYDDQMGVKMS